MPLDNNLYVVGIGFTALCILKALYVSEACRCSLLSVLQALSFSYTESVTQHRHHDINMHVAQHALHLTCTLHLQKKPDRLFVNDTAVHPLLQAPLTADNRGLGSAILFHETSSIGPEPMLFGDGMAFTHPGATDAKVYCRCMQSAVAHNICFVFAHGLDVQ